MFGDIRLSQASILRSRWFAMSGMSVSSSAVWLRLDGWAVAKAGGLVGERIATDTLKAFVTDYIPG